MKLLLTSAGLANQTIVNAMENLLGKSAKGVNLAFIPTAANVEPGDKHWLIDDYINCRRAGFMVDIVDISAVSREIWQPRLESAEVLYFGGGKTMHLKYWMKKAGLEEMLPELLQSRVYGGVSAGSCVTGPTIFNSVQNLFKEQYELEIKEGLGLTNFHFVPHLNSPYFKLIHKENLEKAAKRVTEPVYVMDDNSAMVIDGDKVEIASEGEWFKFN